MKPFWRGRFGAVLIVLAAVLGACESSVVKSEFPDLTFTHLPPIALDAASVQFINQYAAPMAAPHVEHLFPIPPAAAVERWVMDRIHPAGAARTIKVYLEDAAVVSKPLESVGGLEAWFTTEQVEEIEGRIAARLEIVEPSGLVAGYALAEVTRRKTLPEDLTLNQRDDLFFKFVEEMMADLNAQFEQNIKTHLGAYLR